MLSGQPNDWGPQKTDWTKPCSSEWSTEEKLDNCISFQEAVWGTDLLARLENIQRGIDPQSLFIQGYGVNGQGPFVGAAALPEEDLPADVPSLTGTSTISTCDNALASPVVFGCQLDNFLELSFQVGIQQCGAALTIEQTANAPAIKVTSASEEALYTVLLIDTAVSEVHPIQHFGAVNVEGSSLKAGTNLDDIASFKPYHPPAPPSPEMIPGVENVPFTYELVIAPQVDSTEDPVFDTPINFDYKSFLAENTSGENMVTSYFFTGHCVALSTTTDPHETDSSGEDVTTTTTAATEAAATIAGSSTESASTTVASTSEALASTSDVPTTTPPATDSPVAVASTPTPPTTDAPSSGKQAFLAVPIGFAVAVLNYMFV
jgi:hypothetical protein